MSEAAGRKSFQTTTKSVEMSANWRDDQIQELPEVQANTKIIVQIQGAPGDLVTYNQITNQLRCCGVFHTKAQVNNKLKVLRNSTSRV